MNREKLIQLIKMGLEAQEERGLFVYDTTDKKDGIKDFVEIEGYIEVDKLADFILQGMEK